MIPTVHSKNGVPIRLPEERWLHITEQHGELEGMQQAVLDTVAEPERVLAGNDEELLALREVEVDKWLVVVYREIQEDGFIITAFLTRRIRSLDRRQQVWP
jgi:hypothetical protein